MLGVLIIGVLIIGGGALAFTFTNLLRENAAIKRENKRLLKAYGHVEGLLTDITQDFTGVTDPLFIARANKELTDLRKIT